MLFFRRLFLILLLLLVTFNVTYFASAASVSVDALIDNGGIIVDILGCTDPSANNYNQFATIDNGSCTYDDILGCTDSAANNYNSSATVDDGTCTYDVWGCTDPTALNYNPSATINDGSCIAIVPGCTNLAAINYNPLANQDDGSCKFTGGWGCTDPAAINYNDKAKKDDGSCIYDLAGCMDPNAINYNVNATTDDGSCIYQIFGCTNPIADNYNPNATDDDGSCIISGCTDSNASNYNPNATNDDGSCIIFGCTNILANNYNPVATIDDGSCVVFGCTEVLADNYDPNATNDDGSCIIFGCTDPTAVNYNSSATNDNGTCSYDPEDIPGCMDGSALNYDPSATVDNGTCQYPVSGCTDPLALNYNPLAIINDGSCSYVIPPPEPPSGGGFSPIYYYYTDNNRVQLQFGGFGDSDIDILVGYDLVVTVSDQFPKEVENITGFIGDRILSFSHDALNNRYLLQLGKFNSIGKNNLSFVVRYTDGSSDNDSVVIDVHPLGHVFSKLPEDETRIFGISVFLYDESNNVVVSNNKLNKDGTYGFMVQNGKYKLVVFDNGEKIYDGRFFRVRDNIVNKNIGLSLWEQIVEAVTELAVAINEQVLDNPLVEAINNYIAPTAVTVVSLSTIAAIPWWGFIHYLQYMFTEPLAWLFRRRKKGWGVVYDSVTKLPVDLAVVRLYNKKTGKLISSKVTDRQGRYTFLVSAGDYNLEVIKPKIIFPSKILANVSEDKQYTDLYHGEVVSIGKDQKGVITANIPVDSEGMSMSNKQILRDKFWHKLKKNINLAGPLFAMISFAISPNILFGSFVAIHLILYFLFGRLSPAKEPSRWGIILDKKTNKPLSGAIAKIYSPEYNKMLEAQVTDRHGRYGFLAGNNVYYISASKNGYVSSKTDDIDLTNKKSDEVIGQDIKLSSEDKSSDVKEEVGMSEEATALEIKDEAPPEEDKTKEVLVEEKLDQESSIEKEASPMEEMADKIKEQAQADQVVPPKQEKPEKVVPKDKSDLEEIADKIKADTQEPQDNALSDVGDSNGLSNAKNITKEDKFG